MRSASTASFIAHLLRAYPTRSLLLVLLLAFSGLAEGIGVATVLPLLELAAPSGGEPSALSRAMADALAAVGVEPRLEALLLLIVLGMSLKAAFRLLAMKQVGYTVARVSTDLRLRLIDALLRTRWSYFVSQPLGRFANAISSESHRASSGYQGACALLASSIQALIYLAVAVLVSWKIATFAVLGGAIVVLVLGRLVSLTRRAAESQTRLMKSLLSRLTDALQGIKPIKAMSREKHLRPLLEGETHELNRAQEQHVLATQAVTASQEPLLVLLLAIALYFILTVGQTSLATVLVMAFVFSRLAGRISLLQTDYQTMIVGESAFWSIQESIEHAVVERESAGGTTAPPPLQESIILEDVTFGYGGPLVLEGASCVIRAGQFVALAGPSGSGKTTIADLIIGLQRPQRGRLLIDGIPLERIDVHAWRRQIGYVPQEMLLFHETVFHNVTLGDPDLTREAVEKALVAAGAWEFIHQLPKGMDTTIGERGAKLSGGQRQRVAIARALVHSPKLLILDEATTSLDPETEAAICTTLCSLKGMTIIAISHQPALIRGASTVYHIQDRRLTAIPRHRSLAIASVS